MSETSRLGLPLVQAAQAQKHVTVNEALTRLDALTMATAESRALSSPPAAPGVGEAYIVAPGGSGAWSGHDGDIAFFVNGGWEFATPAPGWRIWLRDAGAAAVFTGSDWVAGLTGASISGAGTTLRVAVLDHQVGEGASSTTVDAIPNKAIVMGVTGRVVAQITGVGVTGWRLGVPGASGRYGSGIGTQTNSVAEGVTGSPVTYYAATPLVLEAQGGDFSGGIVRLAVHFIALNAPAAV